MPKEADLLLTICKELEGAPAEIQVIPYGEHETDKGSFVLDEAGMAGIVADFESRQNDMAIDYEHQTLSGGEAPAAGWIKKLVGKGSEGVWALVEWTPRAKEYLKNREYRYLSPVFLKRISDGHVVRLLGAGLPNSPAIDGMVPLVNKSKGGDARISIRGKHVETEKEVKVMTKLLELLGLAADATEDQAVEAMKKVRASAGLGEKAVTALALKDGAGGEDLETAVMSLKGGIPKEVIEALELKEGASVSEAVGTIQAMRAGHGQAEDLGKKVKELEARLARRDAEEAVALAMKEGKVTPAQREWALKYAERDLEGFKAFAAKAPVAVDTKERGGKDAPGGGGLDSVQVSVNKMLGVSEEAFKKHNTKED